MFPRRFAVLVSCLLAGALAAAAPGQAADFKGKTVHIVVGFTPGGGYDANARLVAAHLGKHLPGTPAVITQNMPGAGSLTAVKYLDTTAPTDGTAITVFNPGLVTESIVSTDTNNKEDFSRFAWVGSVTSDFRVCYGFGDKGVKSWDDMMSRKEFILGSTAKGAGNYINGATLRIVFNAPVKQILGFPGSAEQRLAVERGELDGDCGSISSVPPDWIRDKKAHPFVRFTDKRPPEIPQAAVYIGTKATSDAQRQLLGVLSAADEIGRPFIMSRKVPADVVRAVRDAFNATLKDKDFLADAARAQLPVNPLTGEETQAISVRMAGAPANVVAEARKIYE